MNPADIALIVSTLTALAQAGVQLGTMFDQARTEGRDLTDEERDMLIAARKAAIAAAKAVP